MQDIGKRPRNILTFDLVEHFHASCVDSPMRGRQWSSFQIRTSSNIEQLLGLLARHPTRATFFAPGWLAERHPSVIHAVSADGHEIASLGLGHELVTAQTPDRFRKDIRRARHILEDVTGHPVIGFRAPSLSITAHTPWTLPIVAEEGFLYDSSVLTVAHNLAGSHSATQWIHRLSWEGSSLWEIPPSTLDVGGFRIPVGGGSYLRALRYPALKSLLSRMEALADEFTGKVVRVIYDDTIKILHDSRSEHIRLYWHDCPEK